MRTKLIKISSVIILIFWGSTVKSQENPYEEILKNEICLSENGKPNQKVIQEFENNFIEELEYKDATGKSKKEKGKLLGAYNENTYGERAVNLDKLKSFIIESANQSNKECYRALFFTAVNEWVDYYNKISSDYGCGLSAKSSTIKCGALDDKSGYDCEVENGKNISNPNYYAFLIDEKIKESDKNEKTCNKDTDGNDLENVLTEKFNYLKEVNNSLIITDAENEQAKLKPAVPTSSTEAQAPCNSRDCDKPTEEQKNKKISEQTEEKICCDNIEKNWYSLGFSLFKGEKPSEKMCKDMRDPDKDKSAYDSGVRCVANLAQAFIRGVGNGLESLLSLFGGGWTSGIGTLWHEIQNDPLGVVTKILKDMAGYDEELLSCVNGHTKFELACAMAGKFLGNNFGVGVGVGTIAGAGAKVAKMAANLGAKNKIITKIATSAAATNGILKTAVSAGKTSLIWPYTAPKAAIKITTRAASKKLGFISKPTTWSLLKGTGTLANSGTRAVVQSGASKIASKFKIEWINSDILSGKAAVNLEKIKERFNTVSLAEKGSYRKKLLELERAKKGVQKKLTEAESKTTNPIDKDGKALLNDRKELKIIEENINALKTDYFKNVVKSEARSKLTQVELEIRKIEKIKKTGTLSSQQVDDLFTLKAERVKIQNELQKLQKVKTDEYRRLLYQAGIATSTGTAASISQTNTSFGIKDDKKKPKLDNTPNEVEIPQHQNVDETKSLPSKSEKPKEDSKANAPAAAVSPKKEPVKPTEDAGDLPPPPDMRN